MICYTPHSELPRQKTQVLRKWGSFNFSIYVLFPATSTLTMHLWGILLNIIEYQANHIPMYNIYIVHVFLEKRTTNRVDLQLFVGNEIPSFIIDDLVGNGSNDNMLKISSANVLLKISSPSLLGSSH